MTREDTSDVVLTIAKLFDALNDRIDRLQIQLDDERRAHGETRQQLEALKEWPVLVTEGTERLENG